MLPTARLGLPDASNLMGSGTDMAITGPADRILLPDDFYLLQSHPSKAFDVVPINGVVFLLSTLEHRVFPKNPSLLS